MRKDNDTPAPTWFREPPSQRVAELIHAAAGITLDNPLAMHAAIDDAVFAATDYAAPSGDVVRACVRANLSLWCTANLDAPGLPVIAVMSPANIEIARDAVRFGCDDTIAAAFHAGQHAALTQWTQLAFSLTSDTGELRELLDVMMRSTFAFADETLAGVLELVAGERRQLAAVDHTARLETVSLLIEGAPIDPDRATRQLRYELDREHRAAVVWCDARAVNPVLLDRAIAAFANACDATARLTILPGPATIWAWAAGGHPPRLTELRDALDALPGVRMATGSAGEGPAGFRRTHLDAVATQRVMRRWPGAARVAEYPDIELVALATGGDAERAAEFAVRTLGDLAGAEPELRETLRVYLKEGSSTTRTAEAMFAHRNTVVKRLDRIRALLPEPFDRARLQVALALEIVHVMGTPTAG